MIPNVFIVAISKHFTATWGGFLCASSVSSFKDPVTLPMPAA